MAIESYVIYNSPQGEEKEAIKQQIKKAINTDPTRDPLVVIEGSVIQTGYDHLDKAIVMMDMINGENAEIWKNKDRWETISPTEPVK